MKKENAERLFSFLQQLQNEYKEMKVNMEELRKELAGIEGTIGYLECYLTELVMKVSASKEQEVDL